MGDVQPQVVDTIVRWALQLERPAGHTRIPARRLLFGDAATGRAVRAALESRSDDRCAYVVRNSTDDDAVTARNQRPTGVATGAAIVYLVFWLSGEKGHERNFESLRDFPAVALEDLLTHSDTFVLPQEEAIAVLCAEAAQAWPEKDRGRASEHLLAAWRALRKCLRERRGGRDRSIPFIERLEDYIEYLAEALVPEDVWRRTAPAQRAAVMVERWGRALPRLSMFTLPALASVIGIKVDPAQSVPSPKESGEARWIDALEEILAENKETATDFPGLGENIAGHQTLRERLDDLTAIPLCQAERDRNGARGALERFCQSGDVSALRSVEWLFLKEPANRRSASQGLKGLLIARKLRTERENPLDRAARDTTDLIERLAGDDVRVSGVVRQFVESRRARTAQNAREASAMADILRAIASGTVPSAQAPEIGPILERVLASPDRKAEDFERLARWWEKFGRADSDAPVVADSVLLGLVKLSYARLQEDPVGDRYSLTNADEGPSALVLTATVEGERESLTVRVDDWSEQALTDIQQWLLNRVRPLYFDDSNQAADEDEDQGERITLYVDRVRAGTRTPFGVVEIPIPLRLAKLVTQSRTPALVSVRREGQPHRGRLLGELFETGEAEVRAEDPRDDALSAAWTGYVRALGEDPGWGAIACVAPFPAGTAAWVSAWAEAVASVGTRTLADDELRRIEEQLEREDTDAANVRKLMQRRRELLSQQARPAIDVATVRSLLRLCTGRTESDGQVRRFVLNPHHPLVLRLRLVGDRILATTLRQLWTVGWDRRSLDDLDGALEEWGLPEPIHCYGFWDGQPLVFDGWLDEGFALFSPLGAGRELDSRRLGVREVARQLERYGSLFPTAEDRLRLRLYGDPEGQWAWSLLSKRLEDSSRFAADVELLTSLPLRQPTVIDQGAQFDEVLSRAFEPGVDGALPRIRVKRERATGSTTPEVHVSAVVGDLIEEFRPEITPMAVDADTAAYDKLDPRVFSHELVPDLLGFSFLVGDAPDDLSRAVAKAVGFAAGHPNQVFRERYSFDGTRCSFRLSQLQTNAHWLVLASRHPLYRAVQQCGTSTLLDFYSATERGRPVHVCVSLDKRTAERDIARLRRMLQALASAEIGASEAEAVLASARALAPGLAMRCIGSTGGVDLSGLVGLLLSARATEANNSGLVLALDQHRDLLSGRGQRGDLLRIRIVENNLYIDVVEAKFSTAAISPQSAAVVEAQQQLGSTIERLAQFSLEHPLILRTRSRLARAIVQRIHLVVSDQARVSYARELLDAVANPHVKIVIGESASASIHAWSVDATTQEAAMALPGGESLRIHGRDATLEELRALS